MFFFAHFVSKRRLTKGFRQNKKLRSKMNLKSPLRRQHSDSSGTTQYNHFLLLLLLRFCRAG